MPSKAAAHSMPSTATRIFALFTCAPGTHFLISMDMTCLALSFQFVSIDDECRSNAESPPCFTLLSQFYNEHMIPTFPLEDERDDLDYWLECFRFQTKQRQWREQAGADVRKLEVSEDDQRLLQGNAMDVILMIANSKIYCRRRRGWHENDYHKAALK